jgi:hypothetical protein
MSSPIDNYRNYLATNYPDMKLPAGKPYGVIKLAKGYDFGFHVRKDHVSVHFISNGTHDPEEVMGYINDNGIGDKTYGDGLEPDVFRGTRNAAVVRCEVHIPLESVDELRKPTLRKHSQQIFSELYDDFSGIAGVEKPKPKEDTAETVEEVAEASEHTFNNVELTLEGYGYHNELFDISNANLDLGKAKNTDYWYDDNWQLDGLTNSDGLISYSLPLYNEQLKIKIDGPGFSKEVNNTTLKATETLDDVFTESMHKRFSGVGSERTPLILFQFATNGLYNFEPIKIPDGEEFDIDKLSVETMVPIAEMEWICLKRFVYEYADGSKKYFDFNGGEYNETPYEPNLITWFDVIEGYGDNLSPEQRLLMYFVLFEHSPDEVMYNLECYDIDSVLPIISSPRCPVNLLQAVYDEGIEDWLENGFIGEEKIFEAYKNNPNTPESLLHSIKN